MILYGFLILKFDPEIRCYYPIQWSHLLIASYMKDWEENIGTAMLVAMESGLEFGKDRSDSNRVTYDQLLQSNVETASDFYATFKESNRTYSANLLEFHSWVYNYQYLSK